MDNFEFSPTSLRHDEKEDHCVEDRQAAKQKTWSAVGIGEENRDDQNDTEILSPKGDSASRSCGETFVY